MHGTVLNELFHSEVSESDSRLHGKFPRAGAVVPIGLPALDRHRQRGVRRENERKKKNEMRWKTIEEGSEAEPNS